MRRYRMRNLLSSAEATKIGITGASPLAFGIAVNEHYSDVVSYGVIGLALGD